MRIVNRLPNWHTFLTAFVSVMLLYLATPSAVHLQSQVGEKSQEGDTVLERGEDFRPPVIVTLIKSQAGEIRPGKSFDAGEDWFRGLTFNLRNDSEKPINYIGLSIRFPARRDRMVNLISSSRWTMARALYLTKTGESLLTRRSQSCRG